MNKGHEQGRMVYGGVVALLLSMLLIGCSASESHRVVASEKVEGYRTEYQGTKTTLAVGNFDNRSSYMQGLFTTNTDRLRAWFKSRVKRGKPVKLKMRDLLRGAPASLRSKDLLTPILDQMIEDDEIKKTETNDFLYL